jgi:hypothetical protein
MKDNNNTNNNNNYYINKASSNYIKKYNTRNILKKRDLLSSKEVSSHILENKFKTIFNSKETTNKKKHIIKKLKKPLTSQHTVSKQKYFHKSSKFTNKYFNIQSDNTIKYKKSKKLEKNAKKNLLKKAIIIDNEGNNNLNINKKFFTQNTSQKVFFINAKKYNNNKYYIKPISKITNFKYEINTENDIAKNLLNIFKNDNIDNNKKSLLSESNSLFINSKNLYEQKKLRTNKNNNLLNLEIDNNKLFNFEKEEGFSDNKRIKDYNNIIDILKLNIDDIKNMVNNDINNNDISDNNSFYRNIPEVKYKNISSIIDNKENFNNNNELKSFMESIILDDFYQSLLYKKPSTVIEKNKNDESFNLSQSISEFDNIKKEKNKYEFEKIIHLPMKKK